MAESDNETEQDQAPAPEQDLCIVCGATIPKPQSIATGPGGLFIITPVPVCKPCGDAWRWREQTCVARKPWKDPLWRPKRDSPDAENVAPTL